MNPSRSPLNIILSLIIIVAMGVLLYMNIRDGSTEGIVIAAVVLVLSVINLIMAFVKK